MPNRVIREGLLDSDKFNALSSDEQMFFVRLMLAADDFGRFDGRVKMIQSRCYPVSEIKLPVLEKHLNRCCSVGLTSKYSKDGKEYIAIPEFNQRIRQKREKYPDPDGCQTDDSNVLTDDSHPQARMPESNPIQSSTETKPSVSFPPVLDTVSFKEVWEDWKQHLIEKKKKITPSTEKKQLTAMAKLGAEQATINIENSIERGYQGIFPPPQIQNQTPDSMSTTI